MISFEPLVEPAINYITNLFVHHGFRMIDRNFTKLSDVKFKLNPARVKIDPEFQYPEWLEKFKFFGMMEIEKDYSLRQVRLSMKSSRPAKFWNDLVNSPKKFEAAVKPIEDIDVEKEKSGKEYWTFDWDMPMMEINTKALKTSLPESKGINLRSISGDIKNSEWLFTSRPYGPKGSSMVNLQVHGHFEGSSWLLTNMIKKNPIANHGVNVMSGFVILSSMEAYGTKPE